VLEGSNESCGLEALGNGTQGDRGAQDGAALQDAAVEWGDRISMEQQLIRAAAAAGSYCPSKGLGPPSSPADVPWFLLSLPDTSPVSSTAGAAAAAAAAAKTASNGMVHGVPGRFPASPSPPQLMLVLELGVLLFTYKGSKSVSWGFVLLLVALLQQSSVEVRKQLMQQRGSLLLQLLYHLLRQDTGLGGQGFQADDYARFGVLVGEAGQSFRRGIAEYQERKGREACTAEAAMRMLLGNESLLSLHEVVLMALQGLVYEHVEKPTPGSEEHLGTVMTMTRGKKTCCWSLHLQCSGQCNPGTFMGPSLSLHGRALHAPSCVALSLSRSLDLSLFRN
jgi:hypothetical protein